MSSDTRERILAVASELFIEQGYEATSLRQIADRLGFTKAALYYHFSSKDQIMVALMQPANELIGELLDRLAAATGVEEWADALEWAVGALFDHLDFFKLIDRNRMAAAALAEHLDILQDHFQMHQRVENAARSKGRDLPTQVRMIAALGAVTGFDDWAPHLLAESDPEVLRQELIAAMRDILKLPKSRRRRVSATTR